MRKVAFGHRGEWGRLLRIPGQAERVWAWGAGPESGQPGWSLCSLRRLTLSSWEGEQEASLVLQGCSIFGMNGSGGEGRCRYRTGQWAEAFIASSFIAGILRRIS